MKPGTIMVVTAGLSLLVLILGLGYEQLQVLLKINQIMIIGAVLILWAVACICSSIFAKSKFEKMIYVIGFIFLLLGGVSGIYLGLLLKNNGITF
ncbi:MAG: hypothetical protein GX075_11635 [Firmicutes bacterium]|nr:hypothetical protein [Bacillota bacterium]